jgi:hypothetical protein
MKGKGPLLKRKNAILSSIIAVVAFPILFLYPLNKMEARPRLDKKTNEEWMRDSLNTKAHDLQHRSAGQIISHLKPENGDCTHAVLITNTMLLCMESPQGFGNELEISNNPSDDPFYFENEHNTVWYKFQARVLPKNKKCISIRCNHMLKKHPPVLKPILGIIIAS